MDKVSACTSQTAGGSTLNRNNTGNSNSGQAVPPITERNRSRQSSHDLELKQDCFLTEINSTEFPYNFHALWHTSGHRRSKLNTLINFPLDNLDMSSFLTNHSQNHHLRSDDYTYDLLGVINHYGNMMGGHYTAYCCSPIDGKWREYNDDKVCSLESPVPTREAYILFYQRRSLSKHIKQRLFTGDHWIHLLPHSPLENSEESSVLDRPVELGQCLQRVRSQSVSPYFHQQKHGMLKTTHNIHSYSLTPQPIRRSLMLHTKELNVNSSSANYSSPQTLRRLSHSAQRHDSDQEFRYGGCIEDLSSGTNQKKTNNDKKGLYQNRYTPQLGRDISQAQTHSKSPTMHKSPPAASLIRHDLSRNNNLSVSLSRTANHQVSLTRSSPDSHDSHPSSSSSYQQTKYSETDKQLGIFESDIDSQVKQHGKHNVSRHDDSPYVSVTENSGEKLVHTVGQNNVNRQQEVSEHASTNTSDRDDSFVRRYSRKHRQKRLAKHEDDIMDRIDDAAKYNDHYILEDSFYSDTENKNAGSHHGQQYAHSSKSGHIETGFFHVKGDSDADSDPSKKSSLHSGYSWEPNHEALSSRAYRQAERQGAKTSYSRERSTSRLAGDALYQNSEHLEHSHLNGGISYQRHATNSQTYNTSQTVGFEGDVHTHSHTDYISNNEPELSARCYSHQKEQKSASLSSSFTPPKDDYSAAGQMLSRKLPSTHTHERTRHLSNDQRSLASFGNSTLPGCTPGSQENKYNFHPPRGVIITTRAETSMRNTRNIPTPCLRESSL